MSQSNWNLRPSEEEMSEMDEKAEGQSVTANATMEVDVVRR